MSTSIVLASEDGDTAYSNDYRKTWYMSSYQVDFVGIKKQYR